MHRSFTTTQPFAFLLATVLFITLAGCQLPLVKTEAVKPTGTFDQACVARCDRSNTQCEQRQRLREEECQQHFKPVSVEYAACVADQGLYCLQPVTCLGAETGICTTQREECLHGCSVRAAQSPADTAPNQ